MEQEKRLSKADKAYDNKDFIHSRDGRTIRILSEYLYPEQYFNSHNVNRVVVFYGSARSVPMAQWNETAMDLQEQLKNASGDEKISIQKKIEFHEKKKLISKYYDECEEIAYRFGKWSMGLPEEKRFDICTGGGPGMMEAANKGAKRSGCNSIGLNISLPFEQEPNQFITPSLNFEFHYFFMRKFWFVNLAKALVAMPGGFGTMDELFENLTLIQTKKLTRKVPVLLYPKVFWQNLIDFDYFLDMGMISKSDLELFHYAETPDEAVDFLISELSRLENL